MFTVQGTMILMREKVMLGFGDDGPVGEGEGEKKHHRKRHDALRRNMN